MYKVVFYRDRNGKQPVYEYLKELSSSDSKDSRIKLKKIREYVKILSLYGTRAGQPFVKHVEGDIWELRPLRDRILFAAWIEDSFVLLHTFVKETRKTPRREIEKAKKELSEMRAWYDEERR